MFLFLFCNMYIYKLDLQSYITFTSVLSQKHLCSNMRTNHQPSAQTIIYT